MLIFNVVIATKTVLYGNDWDVVTSVSTVVSIQLSPLAQTEESGVVCVNAYEAVCCWELEREVQRW